MTRILVIAVSGFLLGTVIAGLFAIRPTEPAKCPPGYKVSGVRMSGDIVEETFCLKIVE